MINGKIKEWHMDPALLQRLATGGSVNIDSLMRDYIKKTDIITEDQLDPDILTEIDNQVARVQSLLDSYRLKADAISLQDIDVEFSTLLENIQTHSGGSATFDTAEIEAYIDNAINEKLAAEVSSAVSDVIGDAVDAAITEKFNDAFNTEVDTVIDSKIEDAVTTALNDATLFNDVRQDILGTVEETYATVARAEDIEDAIAVLQESQDIQDESFVSYGERIDTLEQTVSTDFRRVQDTIGYDDLDSAVISKLDQVDTVSAQLSNTQPALFGSVGQVVMFDTMGFPQAQDIILLAEIAENTEELAAAKNMFTRTIYDIDTLQQYKIDRNEWNYGITRNFMEEHGVSEDNPLLYTESALSSENCIINNAALEITDGTVTLTNNSLIDTGTLTFGFYGTRLKLFTTIVVPEPVDPESSPEVIKRSYSLRIDGKLPYSANVATLNTLEHSCFLCIENLSEGMHRVDITVKPDETVSFDDRVAIDDKHAVLVPATDISPESFYEGHLYHSGDYVTDPSYDEIKSEGVSPVTVEEYEAEAIDFDKIEKRLIYSSLSEKLYYCYNKTLFLLSINTEERLNEIEQRLAALEGA